MSAPSDTGAASGGACPQAVERAWLACCLWGPQPLDRRVSQDVFLTTKTLSLHRTREGLGFITSGVAPSIFQLLLPSSPRPLNGLGILSSASQLGFRLTVGHRLMTAAVSDSSAAPPTEHTGVQTHPSLGPKTCVLYSYLMYIYYHYLWLHLTNCSSSLMLFTLCCVKGAHNRRKRHTINNLHPVWIPTSRVVTTCC